MLERAAAPLPRLARNSSTERPSRSACAIATKLYWPPMPETSRPSSSASDTAAPSAVAIMQALHQREVVDHLAHQDASAAQVHEAVVDHLTGAVQADFEGRGAAALAY